MPRSPVRTPASTSTAASTSQGTIARRAEHHVLTGSDTQGGSSITQQYVKNVLVNNGVREATTEEEKRGGLRRRHRDLPDRKLKEMRYAITLEKKYSKDEILLGYLNIAGVRRSRLRHRRPPRSTTSARTRHDLHARRRPRASSRS